MRTRVRGLPMGGFPRKSITQLIISLHDLIGLCTWRPTGQQSSKVVASLRVVLSLRVPFSVQVNFLEDNDKGESRNKGARKPVTTFKGTLLDISPAEELSFGCGDTEKKSLIILSNVAKNPLAFKVRTTAPEKYRVKPSSSTCEPGASVDIVVSLHGGSQASPQDRFLVMAAEMDNIGSQELAQFWKEVQKTKIMEHRLRCHVVESIKPAVSLHNETGSLESNNKDINAALMRLVASNSRLEQRVDMCMSVQKVLACMVLILLMINLYCMQLLMTAQQLS